MSEIETYLDANAAYEDADRHLRSIASILSQVGGRLASSPEATQFSNVQDGEGLPADIALSRSTQSFDANEWPTPKGINSAIKRRFDAKRAVQTAWNKIPDSRRASLVPPRL